jgi:hypothetical protein
MLPPYIFPFKENHYFLRTIITHISHNFFLLYTHLFLWDILSTVHRTHETTTSVQWNDSP